MRGCSRRLLSRGKEKIGLGQTTSSGRFLFVFTALLSYMAVLFLRVVFSFQLGLCHRSACTVPVGFVAAVSVEVSPRAPKDLSHGVVPSLYGELI